MTICGNNAVRAALGALALAASCTLASAQGAGHSQQPGAALVERYVLAFNAHDADAFRDVIANDYVQHNGRAGQGLAGTQATLRGYFQTFPDMLQPTGKRLAWGDIEIWRVADGKFVEHWDQSDLAGLARQMRPD